MESLYAQCLLLMVELNPLVATGTAEPHEPKWVVTEPQRLLSCWLQVSKGWVGTVISLKSYPGFWIINGVSDVRLPKENLHTDWGSTDNFDEHNGLGL